MRCWRSVSFNHFIGAQEKRLRNLDAEHIGCLQVDEQLEFGGLLDRQVSRFCALQYPVYIACGPAKQVSIARAITHQASVLDKPLKKVHCGQPIPVSEIDGSCPLTKQDRIGENDESLSSRLVHCRECLFQPHFS